MWSLSRRALLKISLGLSGLLTFWGMLKFLSYKEAPGTPTRITLDAAEAYSPGAVTLVPEVRAWLVRDEDGLYAVSGVCTHLGCMMANHNGSIFECPCHGSKFDLDGAVLNGPAKESLRHVQLTWTPEDKLMIDTQVVVPAAQRLITD